LIASYRFGGVVWDMRNTRSGLERMGFTRFFYLEDTGGAADCTTRARASMPKIASYAVEFLENIAHQTSPTLAQRLAISQPGWKKLLVFG